MNILVGLDYGKVRCGIAISDPNHMIASPHKTVNNNLLIDSLVEINNEYGISKLIVGLPKKMNLKLVEPLKFLFKDEVRKLGLELNLSKEIISRHPFPGPGLAIRMPGIITNEKIKILKEADYYFIQALKDHGLYHKIWQAYAALLPIRTD